MDTVMINKLTPKQERFVQEYLIDLNATQASIRAGYSERTAKEIGHEHLTKPHIQKAIAKAQKTRMEKIGFTAQDLLRSLVEVSRMSIDEVLNNDGTIKPVGEWSEVWRTNISALDISITKTGDDTETKIVRIKIPDKLRVLELLGRHMDVMAWRQVHKIETSSISERIHRAKKRMELQQQ